MTYGWAVLVIAIVLTLLFELNLLSSGSFIGQRCVGAPGFSCGINYLSTNGTLSVTISQFTRDQIDIYGASCASSPGPSGPAFGNTGVAPSSQYVEAVNGKQLNGLPAGISPGQAFSLAVECFESSATPNMTIGSPFQGTIWLNYTTPTASGYQITPITSLLSTQVSSIGASISPSQCTPVVFATSTSLSSDLITNCDVIIDSGVTLTTDGYSIISGGTFNNMGTVEAGFQNNGAPAQTNVGSDLLLSPGAGNPGGNEFSSYAGSGGGGQGVCECGTWYLYGGPGGGTQVSGGTGGSSNCNSPGPGTGQTPTAPTLTSALIASWYASGIQNYISAAGGGSSAAANGYNGDGCTGQDWYGGAGGGGSYGIYIQANKIIEGTIDASGQAGSLGGNGVSFGGGGGGGGLIVLAYGFGGLSGGTATAFGGTGATGGAGGGIGGVLTFNYGASPPVPA